jgi:hypothetical protein
VSVRYETDLAGDHQAACRSLSKFVASVLFGTGTVAPNPAPRDLVSAALAEEIVPQILIGDRNTTGIAPLCRTREYSELSLQVAVPPEFWSEKIRHSAEDV